MCARLLLAELQGQQQLYKRRMLGACASRLDGKPYVKNSWFGHRAY